MQLKENRCNIPAMKAIALAFCWIFATAAYAIEPSSLQPGNFRSLPTGSEVRATLDRGGDTVGLVTVIGHINATPQQVYAALTDNKLSTRIFKSVKENKERYRNGNHARYYSVLDFPWPMDDRWSLNDTVFYPDLLGLRWNRVDGSIKVNEGAWRLFPSDQGTLIIYQVRFDPGLSLVPDWLVEYGMKKEAPGIVYSLRNYFSGQSSALRN